MDLDEYLATLSSLQLAAVKLIYFEDHTFGEASRALAIEGPACAAALSAAYRSIADWVLGEGSATLAPLSAPKSLARLSAAPGGAATDPPLPVQLRGTA